MNSPGISVIIPVYNGEKYLIRCLDSVVPQLRDGIEIVCVDDGSSDGSPEILRTYAEKYRGIRVIRQANGGLAAARNTGIRNAGKEYVFFLDCDDRLAQNALEKLAAVIRKHSAPEVIYFSGETEYETEELKKAFSHYSSRYQRHGEYPKILTGPEMLVLHIDRESYWSAVVFQLYRKSFLEEQELWFREGILHEDNLFTVQGYMKAKAVFCFPETLYYRLIRGDSIMTEDTSWKHLHGHLVTLCTLVHLLEAEQPGGRTLEALHGIFRHLLFSAFHVWQKLDDTGRKEARDHCAPGEQVLVDTLLLPYFETRDRMEKLRTEKKLQKVLRPGSESLREENEKLKKELRKTRKELERIRGSRLYRLIHAVTAQKKALTRGKKKTAGN